MTFLDIFKKKKEGQERKKKTTNQKRINNFSTYRNFAPSYLHAAVSGGKLMCKKTQTAQSLVGQILSGTIMLKY